MYEDIITDCAKKLAEAQRKFLNEPTKIADFNLAVQEAMLEFGKGYIAATLAQCDQFLRDSLVRRAKGWWIVGTRQKTLVTCIGDVHFEKTLFKNKTTGEYCFLLDQLMGISPKERMTDDAVANVLQEAVQSSYRKGGEAVNEAGQVSKETVMEKVHLLVFPTEQSKAPEKEKRIVDYIFIDADEDHEHLQFNEKKGDLQKGDNGYKNNTEMAKLVYVYEGVEPESPGSKRNKLINVHYISGTYKGTENNNKLWDEVYAYMDHTYDLSKVKGIYLEADEGTWIQTCVKRIAGITYALDEFHLMKYLNKMTNHLLDSAEDARKELIEIISTGTKEQFRKKAEEILGYAETDSQKKRIQEGMNYVLNSWMAAKVRMTRKGILHGCSAEGHVSHVLADRMSSRPMGWCSLGVDKMAHLRAYYFNGGDMLELVRNQSAIHEEFKKAAGAEEVVLSASQMLASENKGKPYGKYVDAIQAQITDETAKKAWFNAGIWGL